jgi:hypothetical protein
VWWQEHASAGIMRSWPLSPLLLFVVDWRADAMRKLGLVVAVAIAFAGSMVTLGAAPVGAATNQWPHAVVNGFSTPSSNGFWLVYADGTVVPQGGAGSYGDASTLPLNGPIVGGAVTPNGKGYWLVAQDGGVFTFGNARFYGSMGGTHLNQPVFSMAPTKSGHGYWLVAGDGGVFTFGDARFYGSTGNLVLNEPITGMTTSPTAKGYRMVAKDGGIFTFGDVPFYGSLPGLRITATNVVGMARIPSDTGYWIARSTGEVYAIGFAQVDGSSTCNPIAAIISTPTAQGYRLVTESGATIPFGHAPGGDLPTGNPRLCPNSPNISLAEYNAIQIGDSYEQVAFLVGGGGSLQGVWNPHAVTRTYQWLGAAATPSNIGVDNATVTFRDNRVIAKTEIGLT